MRNIGQKFFNNLKFQRSMVNLISRSLLIMKLIMFTYISTHVHFTTSCDIH